MAPKQTQRIGIFLALALVMSATRLHHFDALPDASWAVFFLGGYWLRGSTRWAFPILMALAVLVDFFVITHAGISFFDHYCVSAAYWMLAPAYLSLWIGGSWLAKHQRGLGVRTLGLAIAALLVSEFVCYLLTNGSYYWMSATVPQPRSMANWFANFGDWYLLFLKTTAIYVAVGAVLHVVVSQLAGTLKAGQQHDAKQ
ncbi:hypothetical protein [Dyella sp. GSA-30]|uniref:hypothetical protein n=1 Tax=Dyella sp. GSA-30 TaxID=2994496 RepID=UPI00248FCC59|nr:hypothetical protein [Dyella sp. GSA-30]BDU23204.1 hypothetical protein DYGSA30_46610 [Dyella sp. GSA-30]